MAAVTLGKARIKTKKQVTLPDAVMEALRVQPGGEIRFKLVRGVVYLEPVKTVTVPADEAYACTSEWQASLKRALAQVEAGHVYSFPSLEEAWEFAQKLRGKQS